MAHRLMVYFAFSTYTQYLDCGSHTVLPFITLSEDGYIQNLKLFTITCKHHALAGSGEVVM